MLDFIPKRLFWFYLTIGITLVIAIIFGNTLDQIVWIIIYALMSIVAGVGIALYIRTRD